MSARNVQSGRKTVKLKIDAFLSRCNHFFDLTTVVKLSTFSAENEIHKPLDLMKFLFNKF